MKRSEIFFGLLRIPVDFMAALGALFAAYYLRAQENVLPEFLKHPDLGSFPSFPAYLKLSIIGAVFFIALLVLFRLYSLRVSDSFGRELRKVLAASIIWLTTVITYYFVIREFPFSRLVLFYAAAFLFIFVGVGRGLIRALQHALLRRGIGVRHVLLIGGNKIAMKLEEIFAKIPSIKIVGHVKNFAEFQARILSKHHFEEVIQTEETNAKADEIIDLCREHHVQYHFVPDLLELHRSNIEIRPISGIPLISLKPTSLDGWSKVLKRAFDIVASAIGLIICAPFFLIIALLIKLDSAGTIFFRYLDNGDFAQRVGERGELFHCLKFRTMQMGTHNLRYTELSDRNIRKGTPLVKIKDDPRVTRVGRILRKLSLDELPQLWNVFTGEMSLVGPRPHLPEEVARYDHHHKFVLTIKPGITGLAQISGRSDLPFEEEVRLDTYYIENWSLWLDIKILVKTVGVLFKMYKE